MFFKNRDRFPTYQDALAFVKKQRHIFINLLLLLYNIPFKKTLLYFESLTDNTKVPRFELTELAERLAKTDLFGAFGDFQN